MAQYDRGRRFEHVVRAALIDDGYDVVRSAGSKTKIDLVGFKTGQVLLVQCKLDGQCRRAERMALLRVAGLLPGVALPILAYHEPRVARPFYWRLTGPGFAEREPWTPDLLGVQP